jgi:hypothetical protein
MQAQASAEALKEAAQSDADAIKGLVASQKAELGNLASQIVAKRAEHVAITEKLDTARAAMQKLLSS